MRIWFRLFARTAPSLGIAVIATTAAFAQAPAAITDPRQIASQRRDDLQAFTIEKLMMTRNIGDTAWSPDGRQIAFISNISGRNNLWLVPAEGGWPTQLTVSDQRQMSPAWSPSGKYIAFVSDKNGNEQWDVYIVSPTTGEVMNLTNTPSIAEMEPAWSPDSRYLAWAAKPQAGANFEIEIFDMLLRRRRALTQNSPRTLSNTHPIWSRDGKWIAYTQTRADEKDANVFVVEVATGVSTNLTPHEGERRFFANDWSPDGKTLLLTSNAANGYDNAALLHVASRKLEWITKLKWEVAAGNFSPDGNYVTFTANIEGTSSIYVRRLPDGSETALALPAGLNTLGGAESAFSRDGSRLLYLHDGPDAPRDAWVYTLATTQSQQVTHALVAGTRGHDMVAPNLVHFPSSDGKFQISAWVYTPYNQVRNGQVPAIVWVHGGPNSQFANGFSKPVQFLVNEGYFVIAPNYRGSSGYGKEFMDANRMDMGGGDLQDVLAAADWVANTGYVDRKKLIVLGGSYGGYMAMMAVTKAPERWAAGIAAAPFVNWFSEFANEDPLLREGDLALMGDPEKNKALWQDRSPINFVDRIKAPVLLLAGGNDPRCPREEAQQVADAVRKNGGKIELKVYENEGHGFARIENQIDAWKRIADFLKFFVPAPGCGPSTCEVQ